MFIKWNLFLFEYLKFYECLILEYNIILKQHPTRYQLKKKK